MKSAHEFIKSKKTSLQKQGSLFNDRSCKESSKATDRMELIDAQKQQLNLNSHLKKVAQVVASSLKVKM